MEEELISKKELLDRYGISYGALYRWKRMGLIPESWFIRRSAPTGQETVFRRDQICARIELIQSQKENRSLEELAASLAERREAVRAERKLRVQTKFGTREFALDEVLHLWLEEDGRRVDYLEYFKEAVL